MAHNTSSDLVKGDRSKNDTMITVALLFTCLNATTASTLTQCRPSSMVIMSVSYRNNIERQVNTNYWLAGSLAHSLTNWLAGWPKVQETVCIVEQVEASVEYMNLLLANGDLSK